jgi:hypothetical protein
VAPLNEHEVAVAQRLVPRLGGGDYLLADGNYDANRLLDAAAAHGYQLVAAQKDNNPGTGHHYQSPARLRCIALLSAPLGAAFGRALLAHRASIERCFGNAVAFAGGLGGALPSWVSRSWRVDYWVWAKLVINAARIHHRQGLAA